MKFWVPVQLGLKLAGVAVDLNWLIKLSILRLLGQGFTFCTEALPVGSVPYIVVVVPAPPEVSTVFSVKIACAPFLHPDWWGVSQVVVTLFPLPEEVQVQVQLSYAFKI